MKITFPKNFEYNHQILGPIADRAFGVTSGTTTQFYPGTK
jgi:hypothetical protein